jgi:bifunctional pyridoxal-dependent enzyme with beta-cystathionase and maltose regulon repressor activities
MPVTNQYQGNMENYESRLTYAKKRIEEMAITNYCHIGIIKNIAQTYSGGQFLAKIEKYLEGRRKAAYHAAI